MLRISTRSRYAVRILICLGSKGADRPVQRADIEKCEGISADYAVQILGVLKRAGFTQSVRGKEGGYLLAVPPDKITMLDVVNQLEGPVTMVPCESESCPRILDCVVKPIWEQATNAASNVLAKTTIKDLIDESIRRKRNYSLTFDI